MGLINKITFNFVVRQDKKLSESFLLKKQRITSIEGLKYIPYTNKIEPEKLQALVNKNLSLNKIAFELGVSLNTIRFYIEKFNILTDTQKEFRLLKKYFTASTREDKIKAFSEIDKLLKQIAKKEQKQNKSSLYEDCLQDVRLRFFEIFNKSRKKGISFPYSILKTIRESKPIIKPEIKTVKLAEKDIKTNDYGIELFESNNYENYVWNYVNNNIKGKKFFIIEQFVRNNKSVKEIAENSYYNEIRIKQIIRETKPILFQYIKKVISSEKNPERIKFSYDFVQKIITKEINKNESRNLYKMKNSNNYYCKKDNILK